MRTYVRSDAAVAAARFARTLAMTTALLLLLQGCSHTPPVTQENSYEGRVAVYATKVVDGVKVITDAVKKLEAAGSLPTAQAAEVIKGAKQIDDAAVQLADALKAYDALAPNSPDRSTTIAKIRDILNRIAGISSTLLVPITSQDVRQQIAALVGALDQTLITLSLELAQGVK